MKHHHEHHHEDQHCQCNCGNCSCCRAKREGCHHEHGDEGHHDYAHKLLKLADHAWMEVLQDKIKENILSNHGKHLEELAKYVSESNSERWKHKLAMEKTCSDFKEKMDHFFNSKS